MIHVWNRTATKLVSVFVQTCKAKQGFGYVGLDEIREVTPTKQNCDEAQWKGLNI